MKKQLLYSVFTLILLAFSGNAQVGFTCENPIVITSLPFQAIDNTANYGNTLLGPQLGTCISISTNYQSGNDVFYSYTAVEDAVVSFILSPTETRSSLFIYPSCSGITGNCLAAVANTTNSPRVINYNVVAGANYTIVISSNSISPTIHYNLLIQKENCAKPINLTVSNSTLNSATFSWNTTQENVLSHQVAVQPQGSLVPSGSGQYSGITTSTFTPTDLTAGTQYEYWVRSECSPGVYSAWAGPVLFSTQICTPTDQCTYTFRMTDSANNGWNGARMQVRQNGIVVATIGSTYNAGAGPVDVAVPLCNGVPFDVFWEVAGSQPQQCILSIINSFGQTIQIINGANSNAGTVIYLGFLDCTYALCNLAPTNVTFNPTTYGGTINWDAPGTENVGFDVYIVPAGGLSPTMTTMPAYSGVNGPAAPFSYTIPSIFLPDTSYDVYVRVQCESPSDSPWSGVSTLTTLPTCPKPSDLTATSITTTSAVLGWTESASATAWDVLLLASPNGEDPVAPAVNPVVGTNDLYFQNITGATTLTPTLQPATIYYYYVRATCQPGIDISAWEGPFIFNSERCEFNQRCNYQFILTNLSGSSWNAGRMEVRQNGIIVGLLGSSYVNSSSGYPISICQDVPFDLYWSQAGNLPQTIGIKIINPFGEVIYTKLPGEGTPLTVLYNSLGSCTPPTCPMPTNIEISNIAQNSVQLSWTESGTASQWEVFATKFGTSAPLNQTPLNSNNPLYHIANTNTNFLVPNLMSSTKYLFYVRAICSANDIGSWTLLNPPSCVTALANDNCADATLLPVNPGLGYIETVSGTTIGATASPEPTNCTGIEDDDVWFSFVATNPIHIINFLTSTGTNSAHYSVFTGDNCNALTQIYCSTTESYSNVFENLIVGNTYKIRVYTIGIGEYVSFEISINTALPPVNDNCDSAIEIPVQPYNGTFNTIQGTLLGATASTENFTCSGSADDDIWYKFTATTSKQQIKFTNNQGSYVTLSHAVYLGTNCSTASLVYCSTVSYGSTPSGLIPGQEYLIRVWSSSNVQQQGSFTISVMEIFPALTTSINQYTTQQLVTDVLVNNPCVSISNITTNQVSGGNNTGIGYFSNTSPFFPISSGIVLSTGRALSAGGPNTSVLSQDNQAIDLGSDTDLETIVYSATGESMISKNATKLEFDFTSQNEFMSFNFLFASEEYGTYQCQYADSFAFLLTDLLTGQTTNLAVVPGTAAPISVVTIRDNQYNMACTSENAPFFDTFFNDNLAYTAPTNFNGQTSVMSASSVIIPNNPYHIKLVIADRGDTAYDSAVFLQAGSFSSGPPECSDKVKLVAFIDANNNGIKEDTENSFTYGSFEYQLNDVGELNHISSPIGNYTLYDTNPLNSYDFSFAVHPEYAVYFSAGTTSHTNITIPVGSGTQTLYFPITQIQGYNDVTVSIIPMGLPVAGFSYYNKIVYTNLGTTPTSGTIDYAKDTNVSIVNTGNGISVTPTGFTYSFNNLAPFETRSFLVKLNVPSIPTVNIGDVLLSNISISAPANDINLNNNAFNISQIVVASYDPNDKMEVHGGKLDIDTFSQTDYLFYTIRFQNTGTANAISIRVEDLLDSQLDEESLRMVSSSHNYVLERVGNHLIWKFDYIYLPSQLENEALSQGYVTFRIKVKPGFAVGDIIPNFAEIYFDTNPPIITNTFLSEFGVNLSAQTFTANTVILYPNPTHSILNVNVQGTSESIAEITIYDIIGKSIKTISGTNSQQMSINVSDLSTGVYMIEIITDTNMKQIKKFIVN